MKLREYPDAVWLEAFNARHLSIACKIDYLWLVTLPSFRTTNLIEHHAAVTSGGGKSRERFTCRYRNVASFV